MSRDGRVSRDIDFVEKNKSSPKKSPGKPATIRSVAFVSLGCPKNLVDSEKMLGMLAQSGLTITPDESRADAIVINTCGFLEASKQEGLEEIARAAEHKKSGRCKRLIVAGCLVQRHRAKLLDSCDQIDAMVGVFDRDHVVEAVTGTGPASRDDLGADGPVYSSIATSATIAKRRRGITAKGYFEDDSARLRLTPRHYCYLRVSEGCNQNCTFCTIPSIRGKMRSKPVAGIRAELREMIADGAFEINLIGQDTTSYGQDIGYAPGLVGLLEEIDRAVAQETGGVGGWVRLMYAYPSCFTDPMIDAIARLPNVVKYIDMPLQHINDHVLTRMRRHTSREQIETLLAKLRDRVPGVAVRTTFITGFPGETDSQHQELVDFIRDAGFEAVGVFRYSPEPGTPAGSLYRSGEAVPADVVEQRYGQLMLTQQAVAFKRNAALVKRRAEIEVLIENRLDGRSTLPQEPGADALQQSGHDYVGRAYFQAPGIDSVVYVDTGDNLAPGEKVRCQIVAAEGYDLVARPKVAVKAGLTLPVLG